MSAELKKGDKFLSGRIGSAKSLAKCGVVLLFSLFAMFISACGTLTTLSKPDFEVRNDLHKRNSRCESVPRIYSGVAYDYCVVVSDPAAQHNEKYTEQYLADFIGSVIADTVVLPYTVIQQLDKGSLKL